MYSASGHRVIGWHTAQHNGVGIRSEVAADADGLDIREDAKALPYLAVQASLFDFLNDDAVCMAQNRELFKGYFTQNANRKPLPTAWLI
jgi:hypothetical protein